MKYLELHETVSGKNLKKRIERKELNVTLKGCIGGCKNLKKRIESGWGRRGLHRGRLRWNLKKRIERKNTSGQYGYTSE